MNENIQLYNYIDYNLRLLWSRTGPHYAQNLNIVVFPFEQNCEIIVCYEIVFPIDFIFFILWDITNKL